MREGYQKIVWVYACVSMIASCVSSVPWCLYRRRGTKIIEIDEHPILNMLNNKVNPYFSGKDFFDAWGTYLALQGKFFAEFNNPVLPTQMYWLFPHFTRPIPDKVKFVSGFEYDLAGEKKIYNADSVMWSKFLDPLDVYNGLSPLKAMSRTIDSENKAVDWNKSTLDNNGVPPGAIKVINPGPDLIDTIRDEWRKRYAGPSNARVPLVLNAEKADYVNFGLDPVDMDFLNQRKLNRIEICAGFSVPSQVVGDPEGQTYSNYSEAVKAFWENTIIPKYLDRIKGTLNSSLVIRYADNLYVEPNLDGIQALHESIDAISKRVQGLWEKNVITQNEAREALGYDKTKNGDVFYMDLTASLLMPKTETEQNETENVSTDSQEETKKKSIDMTEDQRIAYSKAFDSQRETFISECERLFKKEFDKERKTVVKAIESSSLNEEKIMKAVEKALKPHTKNKKDILMATYISVIKYFGTQSFAELKNIKASDSFYVYDAEIVQYITETSAQEVVRVEQTTKDAIKLKISDAFNFGLSVPEIASTIDTLYLEQIVPNRSTLIARTEVISASNYGSLSGAIQSGARLKKIWINTHDFRTRLTHLPLDKHPPVELDGYFNVGGSKMRFPGDFMGPAREVCNCRCAIGYVRKEDE
jgi:HK97 family phage portal protein